MRPSRIHRASWPFPPRRPTAFSHVSHAFLRTLRGRPIVTHVWRRKTTAHSNDSGSETKTARKRKRRPRDTPKLRAPRCAARCRRNLKSHLNEGLFFCARPSASRRLSDDWPGRAFRCMAMGVTKGQREEMVAFFTRRGRNSKAGSSESAQRKRKVTILRSYDSRGLRVLFVVVAVIWDGWHVSLLGFASRLPTPRFCLLPVAAARDWWQVWWRVVLTRLFPDNDRVPTEHGRHELVWHQAPHSAGGHECGRRPRARRCRHQRGRPRRDWRRWLHAQVSQAADCEPQGEPPA